MELNKIVSDVKADKFWQATAQNAEMEKKYNKILNDPNILNADKLAISKDFTDAKSFSSKPGGLPK